MEFDTGRTDLEAEGYHEQKCKASWNKGIILKAKFERKILKATLDNECGKWEQNITRETCTWMHTWYTTTQNRVWSVLLIRKIISLLYKRHWRSVAVDFCRADPYKGSTLLIHIALSWGYGALDTDTLVGGRQNADFFVSILHQLLPWMLSSLQKPDSWRIPLKSQASQASVQYNGDFLKLSSGFDVSFTAYHQENLLPPYHTG